MVHYKWCSVDIYQGRWSGASGIEYESVRWRRDSFSARRWLLHRGQPCRNLVILSIVLHWAWGGRRFHVSSFIMKNSDFDLSKSSGAPALPLGRDADHTRDTENATRTAMKMNRGFFSVYLSYNDRVEAEGWRDRIRP